MTTGYGDKSAVTTTERLLATIIMVVGCLAYSLIVSKLANMLCYKGEEQLKQDRMLSRLDSIRERFNLPRGLYIKVCNYIKYMQRPNLDHRSLLE